ncbi:MAG: GNAT family N-acetyltransferase [Oscillatoriales cyanobacterium SM2_2_1]|nr:GNAT family N-acetyltransferase [Oscillatoriales cyanobacterium SM2_2_1]
MSPQVNLVPIAPVEISQILSLVREFYALENMVLTEAVAKSYGALLEQPEWGRLFWIQFDGAIAGYGAVTFFYSFEYHGRSAIIDELYLSADFRGQGIGGSALAQLEHFCRQQGVACLNLVVAAQNDAAQKLYAKHGFETLKRQLCIKWLI